MIIKKKKINSPQINTDDGSSITVNNNPTYNIQQLPSKDTIKSPSAVVENEKKTKGKGRKKRENH